VSERCIVCDSALPDPARAPYVFFRGGRRVFCGHACRVAFKREPERYVPHADPSPIPPPPVAPRAKLFRVRTASGITRDVDQQVEDVDTHDTDL